MIEGKVFLDSNVLVYAHDVSAGEKHDVARSWVVQLWKQGNGVLSTQVLQEFFVSVTRKLPKSLQISTAEEIVSDLLNWEVIVNDEGSVLDAIQLLKRFKYSFWDSLILHAALRAGATTLLSEDFAHGQKVRGMRIENPFA